MTLYSYFCPQLRYALRIYFKKIYLINEQKMPVGKKTLYLLNHPTSFVDPILLATQTKAYLHFLIRGDVFKKGVALKMLNSINGIPIFRASESRHAKDKNNETFDRIAKVLHKNGSVMIMPEGSTDKRRKLRPFKKGFAHMAMHYWKNYNLDDINIVPVSLSYSDPTRWRSVVHIKFDDPIPLAKYVKDYEEDPVRTINTMRDDAFQIMRSNLVHIERGEDAGFVGKLLKMEHNDHTFSLLPAKDAAEDLLEKEIRTTEFVNNLDEEDCTSIKQKTNQYFNDLKASGLSDAVIASSKSWNPLATILLILLAPFALVGYVANFLPIYGGKRLAYKLMKRDEFICSVKIGAALVFYNIYFFLTVLLSFIFLPWMFALAVIIGLPLTGLVFIYFKGLWKRNAIRFKRTFTSKEKLSQFEGRRSDLREIAGSLVN